MSEQLYCGAGKEKITPSVDQLPNMHGLARQLFADILDDLYVRVILLKSGEDSVMIVSFDLDKAPYPGEFTEELSRISGVPQENILFFGIHTHTVPVIGYRPFEPMHDITKRPAEEQRVVKIYEEFVRKQMLKAATAAIENLRPARMGYGHGNSYINANRCCDYHMEGPDGRQLTIFETSACAGGPVSRDAFVMRIEDLQGKPIAFFMNYAVHCVVMFLNDRGDGKSCISSDLGGNVSVNIEKKFPGTVAVWSSGAAGDINPVLSTQGAYPDPVTGEPVMGPLRNLSVSREFLKRMTGRHLADLMNIIRDIDCREERVRLGAIVDYVQVPASDEVLEKEDCEISQTPYRVRMHLVRIGDVALMGINGELYTSLGEAIKEASPLKNTVIINHDASLMLDNPGYILDDATVERCRKADILRIPHNGFRALPGYLENELRKKTTDMFRVLDQR